jgi:flagellar motor switch protein FliN/FliY
MIREGDKKMTPNDHNNETPKGTEATSPTEAEQEAVQADATLNGGGDQENNTINFILDIPLEISVVLGQTKMVISDLLKLGQGSIVELTKLAGETLDVLANQRLIARGEVVAVDEKYGIRITEIVSPTERIEKLR